MSYFAYQYGVGEAALDGAIVARWREVLEDQQDAIAEVKGEAEYNREAFAVRFAELQANC